MHHMTRRASLTAFIAIVGCASFPATASAALDVRSDGAGGLRITSTADALENVTLERVGSGLLRVREAVSMPTSSDAACVADVEQPTSVACAVAAGATVTVLLGTGNDVLDARTATGIAVVVNGGAGADTLRVGASGTTRVTDATPADTIDLAHAEGGVRVRFERAAMRLVARCGECTLPWVVQLPAAPGRVQLGNGRNDVDLGAWRTVGRTTWVLGADGDRFFGSPVHRSVVDAGAAADTLVSFAPADVLRAGPGSDRVADLGGTGDVISGGGDLDSIASLDGRRDTIDGGTASDQCFSTNRTTGGCDSGPVRNISYAVYLPITTQATVFGALNIRR